MLRKMKSQWSCACKSGRFRASRMSMMVSKYITSSAPVWGLLSRFSYGEATLSGII